MDTTVIRQIVEMSLMSETPKPVTDAIEQIEKIYKSVSSDSPVNICGKSKDRNDGFTLRNSRIHLTYLTRIKRSEYLEFINSKKLDYSLCMVLSECSYQPDGYEHTHIYLKFPERFFTRKLDYFDYEGLAPCICTITTNATESKIIKYHKEKAAKQVKALPVICNPVISTDVKLSVMTEFMKELPIDIRLKFIEYTRDNLREQPPEFDSLLPRKSTTSQRMLARIYEETRKKRDEEMERLEEFRRREMIVCTINKEISKDAAFIYDG